MKASAPSGVIPIEYYSISHIRTNQDAEAQAADKAGSEYIYGLNNCIVVLCCVVLCCEHITSNANRMNLIDRSSRTYFGSSGSLRMPRGKLSIYILLPHLIIIWFPRHAIYGRQHLSNNWKAVRIRVAHQRMQLLCAQITRYYLPLVDISSLNYSWNKLFRHLHPIRWKRSPRARVDEGSSLQMRKLL